MSNYVAVNLTPQEMATLVSDLAQAMASGSDVALTVSVRDNGAGHEAKIVVCSWTEPQYGEPSRWLRSVGFGVLAEVAHVK